METVSQNKAFGGVQGVHRHASAICGCDMTFALYLPPNAEKAPAPLLWYLSGLTCTHENAMTKAGAQAIAAETGMAVVFPDTSPRGEGAPDDEAYDLGQGAGFYVDATEAPWVDHFQMKSYILRELTELLAARFPLDMTRQGITGHSMGGHGALTLAFNNPDRFTSVSAFAPIANPTASDWGRKQLTAYLGANETTWDEYDATKLLIAKGWPRDILIDQGDADNFLELLKPKALQDAMAERNVDGAFRMQPGYDHSYYFVASFIPEHIRWHAERLT